MKMRITPLFGLHSDWRRQLTIRSDGETVTIDLFEDTGWWRGSHLYVTGGGIYVLHEGQGGCFAFKLSPPRRVSAAVSCIKKASLTVPTFADRAAQPSRYYDGLGYLGRFEEGRGEAPRISFVAASHGQENELPDPL